MSLEATGWRRRSDAMRINGNGSNPGIAMKRLRCVATLAALGLLAAAAAKAATVYRWVDEQGKVHYAEVVPERYRGVAKPLAAAADEPTAEQRREALERARREKAGAGTATTDRAAAPASAAASAAAAKRPAQLPNDRTDCETWQRLYMESLECFGPYRTVRGATKPEAFEVCNVVPEPPPTRCRPRIP
jgi:Domain of unknown function (DUF4124)